MGQTAVSIQAYTMNRSPSYFHDALSFLPERWLPDALTNTSSPFFNDRHQSIQAFGTGPRNCLGRHLAWAEMRLTLSKLFLEFRNAETTWKAGPVGGAQGPSYLLRRSRYLLR